MSQIKAIVFMIISFAAIAVASSAVLAANTLPAGWYVEGNLGQSRISDVNYGAGTSFGRTGFGWGGNAGYKFMPFFAAEAGYTKYDDTLIKNSAGTEAGKAKHYSLDLAGKAMLPIGATGIELFAKLGIAHIHSQVVVTNTAAASSTGINRGSRTTNGLFLGVGADYSVLPNFPINVQWTRAKGTSSTGTLDLFSVGLGYIFG